MVYTFQDCHKAVIGIERWSVGRVVNMSHAFYNCDLNLDIGDWDTSQVTNMESMFWAARNFNQPIGRWDTRKVTNMESMFERATAFNQDISGWDTSKVTSMESMFKRATEFNQQIGDWDTRNVDKMSDMFEGASSLYLPLVEQLSRRRRMRRKLSAYEQENKLRVSEHKPTEHKPKSKFGASSSAFGAPAWS
jgi:surface protein